MRVEEFVKNFREKALGLEINCPVGCVNCCYYLNKSTNSDDYSRIKSFLSRRGVDCSFSDETLKEMINLDCDFYGLACSVQQAKPTVCAEEMTDCPIKKAKESIVSKDHDFHELELILINQYLDDVKKTFGELTNDDLKELSRRVVPITLLLADYFANYELSPLSGSELHSLHNLLVINRRKNFHLFDELKEEVRLLSNRYSNTPSLYCCYDSEIRLTFFELLNKDFILEKDSLEINERIADQNNDLANNIKYLDYLINGSLKTTPCFVDYAESKGKDLNELLVELKELKPLFKKLMIDFNRLYKEYSLMVIAADKLIDAGSLG